MAFPGRWLASEKPDVAKYTTLTLFVPFNFLTAAQQMKLTTYGLQFVNRENPAGPLTRAERRKAMEIAIQAIVQQFLERPDA